MNPYIDIHAHGRAPLESSVSVDCLSYPELHTERTFPYTSAGIHPWWLEDYSQEEIEVQKGHIKNLVATNKLWAIGETGIDRAYPEFLEAQIDLFHWHLDLAEQNDLPLVIHSVRAGSDFLQIMKDRKPTTPWIFHDFRGNLALLNGLLRLHSDSYFSFGLSLDNSPQIRELIPAVPLNNLFLETDSQKHLDIHDIYLRAAESIGIDVEFLKAQLWNNFKNLKVRKLI